MMKKDLNSFLKECLNTGEDNRKEKINGRINTLYLIIGLMVIGAMAVLFLRSGVVPGLNKTSDIFKVYGEKDQDVKTIVAGDVYDRNGTLLVKHEAVNTPGVYTDGELYFHTIGYLQNRKVDKEKDEIIEKTQGYRLLQYYADKGTLFKTTDIDGRKGQSIVLTLDHELQKKTEQILQKEMGKEAKGSAVVLDAKTGEILVCIAHQSFDANDLSNSLNKMYSAPKEEELGYPITHKGSAAPGSIFKIVTAMALIDNGLEDYQCLDVEFTLGKGEINNSYGSVNQSIGYSKAIEKSSNVFFANAALQLGKDKMDAIAKKLHIGEELELDFGTVKSNWEVGDNNLHELATTGFGQGKVELSTIYAAMVTQTVANDGVLMQPQMVKEFVDANGKVIPKTEKTKGEQVTSKATANKITDAMVAATNSHLSGLSKKQVEIYKKYKVASKTGTAEVGENKEFNNAWFISFAPADSPQYVVVVNQCKTTKYGKSLMDTVADIYQCLFEN